MNLLLGILAGIIGAAVWAGIAFFTGYEVGFIAWGIGALVGWCCVRGVPKGSTATGIVAVVITLLSILGGKFVGVELSIRDAMGSRADAIEDVTARFDNEEYVISFLADAVVEERTAQGETVSWPPGVEPMYAIERSDYSVDIWNVAAARWMEMSTPDREAYRLDSTTLVQGNIHSMYAEVYDMAWRDSFALMDLVFAGLAVVTAFRLASRKS